MVRGFLFAGAEGVVAASWKVHTNSASLYFQTFYREVRQVPPAEAARRALSAVRAQYPHPIDWAPFRYTGR
jgi:CHAT domain-containing protein